MKEIKFCVSPITNEIYAGYVNKKGNLWTERQNVTIPALVCVAQHCLKFGSPVIISKENGEPEFEIIVKDLRDENV